MTTDVQTPLSSHVQETVLLGGDLSRLTAPERLGFYQHVCQSLGLNPLTRPFEYLMLNGKLTLYARKDCTEQIRNRDGITIEITNRELFEDVYVVTAKATSYAPVVRSDESTGAVSVKGLSGDAKANAMMKAETKAKRRVTLSIAGLGILDESEVESIPAARVVEPRPTEIPDLRQEDGLERVAPTGNISMQTSEPAQSQDAPAFDDPSDPYRAKIKTAYNVKMVNEAYQATPEHLKQNVHNDYLDKLKELGKKK